MKYISKKQQNIINSDTCGELLEILNIKDVPVSITQVKNIKPTKTHYHKIGTEIYWVKEGCISVKVNDNKIIELSEGEVLVISPNETHEVVDSSKKNEIIVINSPRWKQEDEFLG